MRWVVVLCVALSGLAGPGSAAGEDAAAAPKTAETVVSYITGSTVYVDAGRNMGVAVGDSLRVVRAEETVAVLVVTYVSSQRAACDVVTGSTELRTGDRVLYRPGALPPTSTGATGGGAPAGMAALGASPRPADESWMRRSGLRGRVGVRYLAALDRTDFGSDVSRPALDLRLDGRGVGGSAIDLTVDVRASRTTRTPQSGGSSTERRTRVYGLSAAWRPAGGRYAVSLGRQYSPVLASHSFFDGLLAALRGKRWEVGALSGTQPDPVDYSVSSDIWQHSVYGRYGSAPGGPRTWGVTAGLVGSYEHGEINREFVYAQARYADHAWLATATQEIDVNRGWKHDAGGSSVSLTNTFVLLRRRFDRGIDVEAGFDDRSNVLLYRDKETPETAFDDSHRQGYWGGVSARFLERYQAGLRMRSTQGSSWGDANALTLTLGGRRVADQIDLHARSTLYRNDIFDGLLYSLSLGYPVSRTVSIDVSGGQRYESVRRGNYSEATLSWLGLDADVYLTGSWYLALSGERSFGSSDTADQLYANLSYRF